MKLTFITSGAVAALAASLALTAVPASARPNDNNSQWQSRHGGSGDSGEHRGRAGGEERAPAPQAAPQAQAPVQVRQERGNWGQSRQQQPQAAQQQQARRQARQEQQRTFTPQAGQERRADARTERRGGNWQGQRQAQPAETWSQRIQRNGTYSDPNRNTSYRDSSRDNDRNWRDRRNGSDRNDRNDRNWRDQQRSGNDRWQRNDRDHRQWDRNWRSNNQYDWQRYRQYNRNAFHVGRYYAPYRDYSYRRLGIGFSLDPLFFGQDYWIGNPGYYRLPDVYGPYRWVRYYDDALLVDIYSGEVVDVIYDFFW